MVAHAGGWGYGDWGWPMWLAMTIGMTAMLLTLLAIVWLIVRAVGPPRESERSREDRALEELAGALRAWGDLRRGVRGATTDATQGHRRSPPLTADRARAFDAYGDDFLHCVVDDHTRLAYFELHPRDDIETNARTLRRALRFFAGLSLDLPKVSAARISAREDRQAAWLRGLGGARR